MGKNILFVDNDEESVAINKAAFEAEGYKVNLVNSAEEALKKLDESKPDLILTEIMLENNDSGFSLCYSAKKKYPDVPIIILTDIVRKTGITFEMNSKYEKEWIKADEFIQKPVNQESLVCKIKKYL